MARGNIGFLAFNRGLVDPKALGRVDLDRTKLSAEVMTNWIPKTQGAMRIRPGTKYLGSSHSDTGAQWLEFAASVDDTALIELTDQRMRIWIDDALLERPSIATTLTILDTGWENVSSGGNITTVSANDLIPTMTAATTNGVTITAGAESSSVSAAWKAADDITTTDWSSGNNDTGVLWWQVDFGAGNTKQVKTLTIRATASAGEIARSPKTFRLMSSPDGTTFTDEITVSNEPDWAVGEKREYNDTGFSDTGGNSRRIWRFQCTATQSPNSVLQIAEIELIPNPSSSAQAQFGVGHGLRLNPTSIGARAKATKRVIVDTGDVDVEHSLDIHVTRGPVTLRVGSTEGNDDYISETVIGTGWHNLAFTPEGNFHVAFQSDFLGDKYVGSCDIGDTGTVSVTTLLTAADLDNVRYDQSADVIYGAADDVHQFKIERRGTGRSWSFVKLQPDNGPFLPAASSTAKMTAAARYGNTTIASDVPFFRSSHVGTLLRLFHNGQTGTWPLGDSGVTTDPIEMTGIGDTGSGASTSERRITFTGTGTWSGTITIQRSFDGEDIGFHDTEYTDTGTFTRTIDDKDDNVKVWYRARLSDYNSGVAVIGASYFNGGMNGIARVTAFNSNQEVDVEVLQQFRGRLFATESWQEGAWSDQQGYPTAVALDGGRLGHAKGAQLFLSVSDDYENHDDETEGDAGPINRTLGSGPVDNIFYLVSLLRLIIGTAGAEISVRSSSLDEPLTPSNSSAKAFSTQGSANLRALKMDTSAIFVQRSGQKLFRIGFSPGGGAIGDYDLSELTVLVPELLTQRVVSIAIQRQPDTRIHAVLGNGKVAILTYEPAEEVICWSMWETEGTVERAMVLPGEGEDKVYYHVNRTISSATKRYLERWATEAESEGDTGLSYIADCAKSFTHATRSASVTGFSHLAGASVVVCSDDTGQSYPWKDQSHDTGTDGSQRTYTVSGAGVITLNEAVHHAVAGLPYLANWRSTKLAYAAQAGTALAQMKRTDKMGMLLYQTHCKALYFGTDTGRLDPLSSMIDEGAQVDTRKVFRTLDLGALPFPGLWSTDHRIHLRAKSPRPATVLALVPTVATSEKV